ncbi:MAG: DUF2218 domain-containing protein [Burkholderiaceae bacterium]
MQTQSIVKTEQGKKIMSRLCRHWAHKCEVDQNENDALIQLPFGECRIAVNDSAMTTAIKVLEGWSVERAEKMVGSHLIRMAQKEPIDINWQRQVTT